MALQYLMFQQLILIFIVCSWADLCCFRKIRWKTDEGWKVDLEPNVLIAFQIQFNIVNNLKNCARSKKIKLHFSIVEFIVHAMLWIAILDSQKVKP